MAENDSDFVEWEFTLGEIDIDWSTHTFTIDAECPHCDRKEGFGDELTAYAWAIGHIQHKHADELPSHQ